MLELIKRDRVACEVENWRTGSALDWKGVNRQRSRRSELQQLAPIATMLAARAEWDRRAIGYLRARGPVEKNQRR
jgi:hypothetical protein